MTFSNTRKIVSVPLLMATLWAFPLTDAQARQPTTAQAARSTYWVYFTDKGPQDFSSLERAQSQLTPAARQRRAKVRSTSLTDERDLPVFSSYVEDLSSVGADIRIQSRWLNAVSIRATQAQLDSLAQLPQIKSIEPVRRATLNPSPDFAYGAAPSVPSKTNLETELPQLDQIGVPPLHRCGIDGSGVIVGVLDTGFELDIPAFDELEVVGQRDFVYDDSDVGDSGEDIAGQSSHGTGVLSLIAGYDPDGGEFLDSFVGSAPGVSVLLAKTEHVTREEEIEEDWFVAGLEWMEAQGVDVVNASLGYSDWYTPEDFDGKTAPVTIASDIAVENGVVVVLAIGNSGPTSPSLSAPADAFNTVVVGGTNPYTDELWEGSSRGPTADGRIRPDVVAPSVIVTKADSDGEYSFGYGTSFGSPLVAGGVALMLQNDPSLTPAQVMERLHATATGNDGAPNNDWGWGIANFTLASQNECACLALKVANADIQCAGDLPDDGDPSNGDDTVETQDTIITTTVDTTTSTLVATIETNETATNTSTLVSEPTNDQTTDPTPDPTSLSQIPETTISDDDLSDETSAMPPIDDSCTCTQTNRPSHALWPLLLAFAAWATTRRRSNKRFV